MAGPPVSRAQSYRPTAPKLQSLPNGDLVIEHTELLTGWKQQSNRAFAIKMAPHSFAWLGQIAGGFEEYKWQKLECRYNPRVGVNESGAVSLGPIYSNRLGPVGSNTGAANDWAHYLRWIKNLTDGVTIPPGGAPEIAGNIAKFAVEKFTRKAFLVAGLVSLHSGAQGQNLGASSADGDAAYTPGYLVIGSEEGSVTEGSMLGEIYVHYKVRLSRPTSANSGNGIQLVSSSTDGAALALHAPAVIGGHLDNYVLRGNTVQFLRPGVYDVYLEQTGTSPVQDTDGHTVADYFGNAKSDEAFGVRFSADALTQEAQSVSNFVRGTNSSTKAVQAFRLAVEIGDVLTIDDLTSGSLTSTYININEVPQLPMVSAT